MNSLNKFSPYFLALLRIVAGYMFLLHGTAKFFAYPTSMGNVELFSLYGLGGLIEIIGGALLILGLFTRVAAFFMSGQMAYAYFFMHADAHNLLLPLINKGELAALYSLVFLYFVFAGGGAFALDKHIKK